MLQEDFSIQKRYFEEVFPMGFWGLGAGGCDLAVRSMTENNVPLGGPFFSTAQGTSGEGCFEEFRKYGLKMVMRILPGMSYSDFWPANLAQSVPKLDAAVYQILERVHQDPVLSEIVHWWTGLDEYQMWAATHANYLSYMIKAIRKAEFALGMPFRPFMMYEVNNRQAPELMRSGTHGVNFSIKGTYSSWFTGWSAIQHESWISFIRTSTAWMREAAAMPEASPEHRSGVAFDMQRGYDTDGISDALARQYIRRACYTALIGGAKGIFIWSHIGGGATRVKQTEAYFSVATDLNGPAQLAPILLTSTRMEQAPAKQGVDLSAFGLLEAQTVVTTVAETPLFDDPVTQGVVASIPAGTELLCGAQGDTAQHGAWGLVFFQGLVGFVRIPEGAERPAHGADRVAVSPELEDLPQRTLHSYLQSFLPGMPSDNPKLDATWLDPKVVHQYFAHGDRVCLLAQNLTQATLEVGFPLPAGLAVESLVPHPHMAEVPARIAQNVVYVTLPSMSEGVWDIVRVPAA